MCPPSTRASSGQPPGSHASASTNENDACRSFAVRDLVLERLHSLQNLLQIPPGDVNKVVHDVRRELKKLRAILRLMRNRLGEERYAMENASLRDAGRLLSPLRDAWVRLTLLENLSQEFKGVALNQAFKITAEQLRTSYEEVLQTHPPESVFSEALETLTPASRGVEDWPDLTADLFTTCGEACRKTYQRGRSRFQRTLSNPTVANLHELRKQCKNLRYQLEFLEAPARNPFHRIVTSLHKLTDSLGKHHDLATLRETLEAVALLKLSQSQMLSLYKSTEAQQRAALDAAVALGSRIFAAKPKEFSTRLERVWKQGCPKS